MDRLGIDEPSACDCVMPKLALRVKTAEDSPHSYPTHEQHSGFTTCQCVGC
jgi:hypothetical protein